MSDFQAVQLLAVTKAVKSKIAKEARDDIEPGEYKLSFDAHIEGTLRVGQDYEQVMPNKAKPWHIIAVLLAELNRIRTAAGEAGIDLNKIVQMAEAVDEDLVKEAQKRAEAEAALLKASTVTKCKGKVTADLEVLPVAKG